MTGKGRRPLVRWAVGLLGSVLLAAGSTAAWRSESPIPLVAVGLLLVLVATVGDRLEEVTWQGLTVRLRAAVAEAEEKARDVGVLLDELRTEVNDLQALMPPPLSLDQITVTEWDPTTGKRSPVAGLDVVVTLSADPGTISFEVTTPNGQQLSFERTPPPVTRGEPHALSYWLPLDMPLERAPVGRYVVVAQGKRGARVTGETHRSVS